MQIYVWVVFAVCHHPGKLGDHMDCENGEIMLSIFHVRSRDHILKTLCEFMS